MVPCFWQQGGPIGLASDTVSAEGPNGLVGSLPADAEELARSVVGVEAAGVLIDSDQQAMSMVPGRDARDVTLYGASAGLLDAGDVVVRWTGGSSGLGDREALIGELTAAAIGLPESDPGRIVFVNGTAFQVVGVVTDGGRTPDLTSAIVTNVEDAFAIGSMANESLFIRTRPGAAPQVARQIGVALDNRAPDRFEVVAPPDPTSFRSEIESDVQAVMSAFAGLAAIIALAGITNSTSLGVVERTQEFGLRRALGALPRHVVGQVLIETAIAGVAGGVAGLYLGVVGVLAVTVVNGWQPVLDLRVVPLAVLLGAAVGTVGGVLPARRASRIEPIEALRR